MRFVLIAHSAIHLDNLKLLAVLVPVKDSLYSRPLAPLDAPPTRLGAPSAVLCDPCDVDICPVRPRVTSPRVPHLRPLGRIGDDGLIRRLVPSDFAAGTTALAAAQRVRIVLGTATSAAALSVRQLLGRLARLQLELLTSLRRARWPLKDTSQRPPPLWG